MRVHNLILSCLEGYQKLVRWWVQLSLFSEKKEKESQILMRVHSLVYIAVFGGAPKIGTAVGAAFVIFREVEKVKQGFYVNAHSDFVVFGGAPQIGTVVGAFIVFREEEKKPDFDTGAISDFFVLLICFFIS